jgi:hypothetical protein
VEGIVGVVSEVDGVEYGGRVGKEGTSVGLSVSMIGRGKGSVFSVISLTTVNVLGTIAYMFRSDRLPHVVVRHLVSLPKRYELQKAMICHGKSRPVVVIVKMHEYLP